MSFLVEAIGQVLLKVVIWVVVLPITWILATPIILLAAAFAPLPYWSGVKALYGSVTYMWNNVWSLL